MGSLMPGWQDSEPGVPPKELREEPEEEPQGYFAKLEHARSMKHEHDFSIRSLARSGSERLPDMAGSPRRPPPLSMSPTRLEHSLTLPGKYHLTDWQQELRTLKARPGLARASVDTARAYMDARHSHAGTSSSKASSAATTPTWWSRLDASSYNIARPPDDEDEAPGHGHSKAVKLDFSLTGTNLR